MKFMAVLSVLIMLAPVGSGAFPMVLPSAGKVSHLKLCATGAKSRCLHLKRESGEARELFEGENPSDHKITRAEFERKVMHIYNKIKHDDPGPKCTKRLTVELKLSEGVSNQVLCSENYSAEEWDAWNKLLQAAPAP